MDLHSVIIAPVITEKTARLQDSTVKKYTVLVHDWANKDLVSRAFEAIYDVKVDSVRILITTTKHRTGANRREIQKRPSYKKAIITLKKGEKTIDLLLPSEKK